MRLSSTLVERDIRTRIVRPDALFGDDSSHVLAKSGIGEVAEYLRHFHGGFHGTDCTVGPQLQLDCDPRVVPMRCNVLHIHDGPAPSATKPVVFIGQDARRRHLAAVANAKCGYVVRRYGKPLIASRAYVLNIPSLLRYADEPRARIDAAVRPRSPEVEVAIHQCSPLV